VVISGCGDDKLAEEVYLEIAEYESMRLSE